MSNSFLRTLALSILATGGAQAAPSYTVTEIPIESVDSTGNNQLAAAGFDGSGRAYINVSGFRDGVERSVIEQCPKAGKCRVVPPTQPNSKWNVVHSRVAAGHLVEADGTYWAVRRRGAGPAERLAPTASAHGINRNGVTVGFTLSEPYQPFVFDDELQLLPTLGQGHFARAYAINSNGIVVGEAEHPQRLNVCAVFWSEGQLKVLSCPPAGRDASAVDVNVHGVAVGDSTDVWPGARHAVRFEAGRIVDLGALGAPGVNGSWATAINDDGMVVGYGTNSPVDGLPNAILFDPIDGPLEIATLVPEDVRTKYRFGSAQAIDNMGRVLVHGWRLSDLREVVLRLEPVAPALR